MTTDRIDEIQGMFDRGEVSVESIRSLLRTLPKREPLLGRIMVRLPIELHQRLKERAKETDTSLNQLCMHYLEEGLEHIYG